MEKITLTSTFTVYDSANDLPEPVRLLMQRAVEVRKTAYAPYSKFRVGAALQLDNGEVVIGSNQENAAYPSGLCAERVAVFHAGAAHPGAKILTLAISAAADSKVVDSPIPPCGACRQSLAEYEMKQDVPMEIYFMGETGKVYKSDSLKNLLPLVFDKDYL
ncbi:cytidine deaminase [Flavobacterium sp. MFBS3-15]|uniref:cytidine deaminase n=1 Tax=Flavobacterium sp. MFBS3-15 TaxID=2989816 RepID=UPI00223557FD|nr:cytidine deaminase [Flavobacterium sp. MFBS3-15]MCW4470790.1 cytidine deaminase [Flavobacterium sp. MFBS3-15]